MNPIRQSKIDTAPEEIKKILYPQKKKKKMEVRKKRDVGDPQSSAGDILSDTSVFPNPTTFLSSTVDHSTSGIMEMAVSSQIMTSYVSQYSSSDISPSFLLTQTTGGIYSSFSPTLRTDGVVSPNTAISESPLLSSGVFHDTNPDYPSYDYPEYPSYDYPEYPSYDYGESSSFDDHSDYGGDYDSFGFNAEPSYVYYDDFWGFWGSDYYDSSPDYYWDSSDYGSDYSDWASQYSDYWDYYYDDYKEEEKAPKDKWEARVDDFKEAFANSSREVREELGHQIEDMLMYCAFAGRLCSKEDFSNFISTDYGNCYTLEKPFYSSRISGPRHGLALTLNIEPEEYVTNFATGYGIRLVLHEPGTYPFPLEEGLTMSTGYETSIGLRMIQIRRKGLPYGDCEDGVHFKKSYKIDYTMPACVQICKQKAIENTCQCESTENLDLNTTMLSGNDTVTLYQLCIKVINAKYAAGELNCTCKAPCYETLYQKTLSGRTWPNREFLSNALIKDICKRNLTSFQQDCDLLKHSDKSFNPDKYLSNFLKVIIYYEDLNYETIEEEPLYDTTRFVSDIGGTLGLFMGASLLSAVEVLQLIVEFTLLIWRRAQHNHNVQPMTVKEADQQKYGPPRQDVSVVPLTGKTMFHSNYAT
ncbi:hypothetical protein ScPMuIL_005668 [Solemya velum]